MFAPSTSSPIDTLIEKNSKMARSTNATTCPLPVRFMLKRSQRFDDGFMPSQQENSNEQNKTKSMNEGEASKQRLIQRLRKLGLAPQKYMNTTAHRSSSPSSSSSSSKRKRLPPRKIAKIADDDGFVQPRIFECFYCSKIFFHKTVYRRHVINHLRIRRCEHCDQPFKARVSHRRHRARCKQTIY